MTGIEVLELTKEYGNFRAVDHLTFTVRPGQVTGFLGPNGAGKSTTLRLVLGLSRPTSGSALIGGKAYTTLKEPMRQVGALLDAQSAHSSRIARDHLLALAVSNRIEARRVDEVLETVGLSHAAKRRVGAYSLGMRQRLGIAAALLGDPEVLILDEPSNGLDPEGIVWIRDLMRRLAREGRTVLVSSHLMNETASFADHLVVLDRGRLLADATMQDFIHAQVTPSVRVRSSDDALLLSVLAEHGHEPVPDDSGRWIVDNARLEDVGPITAAAGVPILELSSQEATLEAAYFALIANEDGRAADRTPVAAAGGVR
ncbi:ABC transporter ATP-binding protein [Streptomyces naphthomycinicus]|uniref:ABC transporter ATP-binding protein n=1 Tax=Streptomyces naphthomycinicus TaxID=2872625 RepID=UPI001CEC1BB8|nr:ABC transporter ATP-binding protein [Streptomyces sp. TML10]